MENLDWKLINSMCRRSAEKYSFYLGNYKCVDFAHGKVASQIPIATIGWGSRAVEMRSNKTTFDCFENDDLHLTEIAERYKLYDALNKIKEDVLVAGCGFLAVVDDTILPFTAEQATGTYDWKQQNLRKGVAIFSESSTSRPGLEADIPDEFVIYEPDRTIIRRGNERAVQENRSGRPLMVVLTYRATTKKPFGNSVLNHSARCAIIDATRTNRQAMIAAHLYNTKVDAILGIDEDTNVDRVEGQTGDTITISTNKDGQIPQIGEFAQHQMAPFEDTIMISARNFCSATKLVLSNLGLQSDAPQNPEALEIVSDDLRDDIVQWQHELGEQLKYLCLTIFMKENGVTSIDANLRQKYNATVPAFKPTYRTDTSKFGDGLFKIGQQAPGALLARNLWRNFGLSSAEIDTAIESVRNNPNFTL